MQRWYLHELGVSDSEAFVKFNFAPPSIRRRIGLLDFLHKHVICLYHPALPVDLPFAPGHIIRHHDKTSKSHYDEVRSHAQLYNRSLYMYVLIYNRLPHELVMSPSVSSSQSQLTKLVKERANNGDPSWRTAFRDCKEVTDFFYG